MNTNAAGRAPGRSQAGPHPRGGSADVPIGRGADIWDGARQRILMQEVGTRDGLQAEQRFVATDEKIALVNALSDAGLEIGRAHV